MDVYSSVKGSLSDDAETLWSQSYEIFRRWKQKRYRQRFGLDHVARVLRKAGDSKLKNSKGEARLITVSTFMDIVDGLSEKQAQRILIGSEELMKIARRQEDTSCGKIRDRDWML